MKVSIIKEPEFYKSVIRIMLPVALQQAINMGVNMMDTMMLGSFGEIQLSASSLANQYYNFFTILCMGIIGGSSVLAAQYWGAGEKEKVRETFNMALRLSAGVAVLFMILTWIFPGPIMSIYTSEEEVIVQGIRYLKITAFIFVIHGTSLVAAQLMRSVGQAHLGLIVSIISFVVNIGANYIFIFGKFGMPRMEIAGAALGTLIARGAEFITTFFYILVKDKSLGLRICHLIKSPSAAFYRSYFRLGAPVLVSDSLLGLGGNIVSVVLGHMGAAVVASNAICQVVDRLCTVVIQGVSNASGIITGQTLGTGNRKKAMEQGETFYFFSIVFGLLSSLLVFLFGPLTVSVYTLNQETRCSCPSDDERVCGDRVLPGDPVSDDQGSAPGRRRYEIPYEGRYPVHVAGFHSSGSRRRSGPPLACLAGDAVPPGRLCD